MKEIILWITVTFLLLPLSGMVVPHESGKSSPPPPYLGNSRPKVLGVWSAACHIHTVSVQLRVLRGGEGDDRSKFGKTRGQAFHRGNRGMGGGRKRGGNGGRGPPPPTHGQVESPLEDFVGEEVHVQMAGGQEVRGRLRGYDGFGNLVLDNTTEYVMEQLDDDPDSCVWSGKTNKRRSLCAMHLIDFPFELAYTQTNRLTETYTQIHTLHT
jgi:small nuclear ribonucleoprotein (snRNP)-like protein